MNWKERAEATGAVVTEHDTPFRWIEFDWPECDGLPRFRIGHKLARAAEFDEDKDLMVVLATREESIAKRSFVAPSNA
jgi:hypothetical protein